jgi:hypothetical protein
MNWERKEKIDVIGKKQEMTEQGSRDNFCSIVN